MRASQWLLGGATAAAIVATIASGCGGSSSGGGGSPQDASTDATYDAAVEAAKEAAAETGPEAAPVCVPDADITHLTIPDASLGDSGASTDGCYSCIQTSCGSQLASCNTDCTCNSAVQGFLECVASGTSPVTCATSHLAGGGTVGLPLIACVAGSAFPGGSGPGCLHACGVSLPEGGLGDGGGGGDAGGGDTGTDAAAD
jgi:hypothetical protein